MRTILFRGKRIDTGEWVEGSLIADWEKKGDFVAIYNAELKGSVEVDPATVGQYTGLKDKNGVKIFEGDIFSFVRVKQTGYHCVSHTDNEGRFKCGGKMDTDERIELTGTVQYNGGEFSLASTGSIHTITALDASCGHCFKTHEGHVKKVTEEYADFKIIGNTHDKEAE